MARQMHCQGDQIGLLAIVDHASPKSGYHQYKLTPAFVINFFQNLPYRIGDALHLRPDEVAARVRRNVSHLQKTLSGAAKKMDAKDLNVEDLIDGSSNLPAHIQQIIKINFKAICDYNPKHYDGVLTLLRARGGPLFVSPDPKMGWEKFTDQVEIRMIPGSHLALFREPNIRGLARTLQRCLDETQIKPI